MSKREKGTDPAELQVAMEAWKEVIQYAGKDWEIMVKGLSWPQKKKAITASCTWSDAGSALFDWEVYYRMCLKSIIVEAPFPIDDVFLTSLSGPFGELLERLCPNPWPEISVTAAKKG